MPGKQNNKCVYRHRRLDTNEIFYIGIGNEDGAYSKHKRNKHWKNITNNTNYKVEVLYENLSWEDACELEELLIGVYGRKDLGLGKLVNMTDGGEGRINMTKADKDTIRKAFKHNKVTLQFTKNGDFIKEFYSIGEASTELGIDRGSITQVINNKRPSAGGFLFKLK